MLKTHNLQYYNNSFWDKQKNEFFSKVDGDTVQDSVADIIETIGDVDTILDNINGEVV